MIKFSHRGDFKNTERLFERSRRMRIREILDDYGRLGVSKLAEATPKDTGQTADSWSYELEVRRSGYAISWTNSNSKDGIPIVILIQYGHGTKEGGYVEGQDFINPVIKSVVEDIKKAIWTEVSKL